MTDIPNLSLDEPITIAGHSHGGNVGIIAANIMSSMSIFNGRTINILTINTPVREYQRSESLINQGKHINIYDPNDPVQVSGNYDTPSMKDMRTDFDGSMNLLDSQTKKGHAGRIFENAINYVVTKPVKLWNIKNVHNSHNLIDTWPQ